MKLIAIAAASVLLAATAHAQQAQKSPLYGELAYTALKYKEDSGALPTFKPAVLRGIVGYEVNPNVALEAMVALNAKDDSVDVTGMPVMVKVDRMLGFYVKPKLKLGDSVEAFARLGVVQTQLKYAVADLSGKNTDESASWGLGVNYLINPSIYVGADYTSYYRKSGVKIDGVSLSVGYRF